MAITRADITGALKLLHANNIVNRRGHLQNMLAKEHTARDVAKVLSDLESYPEWAYRKDLDASSAPSGDTAVPKPAKRARKK